MLAYCLELIDSRTFTNLGLIGEIRNIFAHSHPEATFADEEVVERCNRLIFQDVSGASISVSSREDGTTEAKPLTMEAFVERYKNPIDRFTHIASTTGCLLLAKSHFVKRCDAQS
jgi:hypothetical protein